MEGSFIIEIAEKIGLPALTLFMGWFGNAWRTKQKKEQDVLTNVTQILEMQKAYIQEQDEDKKRTRDICKRLEAKLDKKNKSIRQAFKCKYSNEGDGCPVLNEDENSDPCTDKCANCTIKQQHEHVDS